jgi:hypothetical protein
MDCGICSTPSAISPASGSPVIPRPRLPVGIPTRGTTNSNRLRRADRWVLNSPRVRAALESAAEPVVVDLGYGRLPVTTLELASRLRAVRPDVRVVGLEIDPERVVPGVDGVEFGVGGFELAGLHPILVRAFNVLRQYPEDAVAEAWGTMRAGLAPLVLGVVDTFTFGGAGELWPCTWPMRWNYAQVIVAGWIH